MNRIFGYLIGLFFLSFAACNLDRADVTLDVGEVEGLRPIYSANWQEIGSLPAQSIGRLGKIYYKDSLIYVAESGRGIHVIDNHDPFNPTPIHFIQVPGCRDIAIRSNFLYADNVTDLVVLDISNLGNVQLVKRVPGLYEDIQQSFPEAYEGYFECVDPERGKVVGWESAVLDNPQCFR
jgi:hypothetical protein